MKTLCLFISLILSYYTYAQSNDFRGVYLNQSENHNTLILASEDYLSIIEYKDDSYIGTKGGPYSIKNNSLIYLVEYDDQNPNNIGSNQIISLDKNLIDHKIFVKQNAKKQALDGLWRITGRQVGNNIQSIARGDRKTIKLLVDGYFQWIAINPIQKGFYGTGGGYYNFKDNHYEEKITFFSRDNSRIGNSLSFKGEVINNEWHHSGKSSKGDPIYEIWTKE